MKIEEWNERYRAGDHPMDPAPLLVEAVRDLLPGRALDLACGAGRNALFLAERGWDVVALDAAEEAIRLVPPGIDARVFDLESGAPLPFEDESFDLVAILYYLHRPLFTEARRVLRPGGLLVSAARMSGRFAALPRELSAIEGFETLVYRESETAELVARRSK